MKIIYKYSKKGKQTNKQKTKTQKISMNCKNQLTLIYSIDQTNKSNSGFSGYYMNQKKVNIKKIYGMQKPKTFLGQWTNQTYQSKKKYKKQIFSMDCRNKKIMRIASNKQIKVSTLNSNYDKYMCLINFFHSV